MNHDIYTTPYSIGKIIKEAVSIFGERFNSLGTIVLITTVPVAIIALLLGVNPMQEQADPSWSYIGVELFGALLGVYGYIAILHVVKSYTKGESLDAQEALSRAKQFMFPVIGTSIVWTILLLLLSLLFIIPGIIFAVYWMFAIIAVVYADKKGVAALKYSKEMVKGRWWKTAGYSVVIVLIFVLVAILIGMFYSMYSTLAISVSSYIPFGFLDVFVAVIGAIWYLNFDSIRPQMVVVETREQPTAGASSDAADENVQASR